MTTATTTLTEFLLARIAEDEDHVKFDGAHWQDCGHFVAYSEGGMPCTCHLDERLLAECEAKRRIVEIHMHDYRNYGGHRGEMSEMTLELLALPYSAHPDYRDEWRP